MFSSTVLTALLVAGSAAAAGSWDVRADFSRCPSATPLDVVLDGASSRSSPAANVIDFQVPSPFNGALVIKVAGSVGYGSPYPPQQVGIKVNAEAAAGITANATVKPGLGEPVNIAQVSWSSQSDKTVAPTKDEQVSLETTVDGDSLVVYYCGAP